MLSSEDLIKQALREQGFDLVGIAPAHPLTREALHFHRWIESGYAGGMDYLERNRAIRADPGCFVQGARSVIVVAGAYPAPDGPPGPIAAYACSRDYHLVFREALEKGVEAIHEIDAAKECRIAVDSSPLLERALAARAGLGWIGYSTNLITPRYGPFVLLGLIVTTLALKPDSPVDKSACDQCGKCLEACPTGALKAPYLLDARRCISYLTIEKKGDFETCEAEAVRGWAFGCDLCTLACASGKGWTGTPPSAGRLLRSRSLDTHDLEKLKALCEKGFKRSFKETALLRTGKRRMLRNIDAGM